jgi:hypothetical protein
MYKLSSLKVIRAFSVGLALSVSTSALAETKTYCDDACNLNTVLTPAAISLGALTVFQPA